MLGFLRSVLLTRTGGVYSVAVDDRGYAVARVVATGRRSVHVRVYSNRYRDRPKSIERSQLFLAATPDLSDAALNATYPDNRPDPGAFAIGHVPLRRASFAAWRPQLIRVEPLEPADLVDYRAWRTSHGGRW
jgi:antitoxin (DNA-binding transcriptional repressor) of toxin-antitoxin stability system